MGGAMSSTGKSPGALGEEKSARPSSWRDRGWQFGIALALGISGAIASSGNRTLAQITPDTSLGAESSVVTPNVINSIPSDQIDGGAVRGVNLFHSFSEFNVNEGAGAFFSNPTGIENILSRVTGTDPSDILGTIGVLGNANLFLINPNGIIFGPNATLNVAGSFVATTADAIAFPDGNSFSASAKNVPAPTLTVSPSAFLFNQIAAAPITNQSRVGLQVPEGESLLLLGGNVNVDGGVLRAPGGLIQLGGVASSGTVNITDPNTLLLSFPDDIARTDVSLTNGAIVDVVSGGGGDIAIYARNIGIAGEETNVCAGIGTSGSSCDTPGSAVGSANSTAGNILFDATGTVAISQSRIENNVNPSASGNSDSIFEAIANDTLFGSIVITAGAVELTDGAVVSTSSFGTGSAGLVAVKATSTVSLDNSGMFSGVQPGARGDAGGILIDAESVSLSNSTLDTTNFGSGIAGDMLITASDQVSLVNSTITSRSENDETADFGIIEIEATEGSVLINQSTLSTSNFGSGFAGDIVISAPDEISINQSSIFSNGLFGRILIGQFDEYPDSLSPEIVRIENSELKTDNQGSGVAGDISLDAIDSVSIANSIIFSNTYGSANAGNIFVQADGSVSIANSFITSDVATQTATGNSGSINVTASSVSLTDGAQLSTSTFGQGNAGAVIVETNGGTVSLDASTIFSNVESGGVGNGGNIEIYTGSLSMSNGAQLQTLVRGPSEDGSLPGGQGDAGIVYVEATGSVALTGAGTSILSVIDEGADGNTGNNEFAGNIFDALFGSGGDIVGSILIATGSLSLTDGALINASTYGLGNAGAVVVVADDTVSLTNGSGIGSVTGETATGNAGGVLMAVGSLSISNESGLITSTFGQGDAGLILVLADDDISMTGEGSGIFSTVEPGVSGTAGGILIEATTLSISDGAQVSVNNQGSGEAGDIIVSARDLIMEDEGQITATTLSGQGGDIELDIDDLLVLTLNSDISTTAGLEPGGGDGGNIYINAQYIFAAPTNDSNITAQAYTGTGGNIQITTDQLFDIARRLTVPSTNDISASSELGIDGVETVNTLNVDPTQGLTNLPVQPIDPSGLIAQNCPLRGRDSAREENKFTITGRGGLPSNPNDTLQSESVVTNWVTLDPQVENPPDATSVKPDHSPTPATSLPKTPTYAEAQGWVIGKKGEVILTAQAPTVTPQSPSLTPADLCNGR